MKKTILMILFLPLVITVEGCSSDKDSLFAKLFKGGGSTVPVTVENVIIKDRSYTVEVPAVLRPSERREVTLPADATIERVYVAKGDSVAEGDPLFQISEGEIKSQLARLNDNLRDARAEFDKNSYLYNNRDRLLEEERIDQVQYDNLEIDIDTSETLVTRLQGEMAALRERPRNSSIPSPISGIVEDVSVAVGVTAAAGKPLVSITQFNPMLAEFELASYESATVNSGTNIDVRLPDLSADNFKGKIVKVDSSINPDDQSFKVWASVPNPKGFLKAGMSAEVQFTTSQKQRFFLIPSEALIRDRRRYYVFTVINGVAHRVEVVPKEKRGKRVEIAKGLREDDLVVVKGHDELTEGTVVDIWGR
ncbi:MAG: efflux RND transporter periplasmic adaptor subunit [Deltaproteobacteria bacterium]|nr:efflux RND transporter periplasmic adaptor subunit [Deltaproteobacteria bacterium]